MREHERAYEQFIRDRFDRAESVSWLVRKGVVVSVHGSEELSHAQFREIVAGIHPNE